MLAAARAEFDLLGGAGVDARLTAHRACVLLGRATMQLRALQIRREARAHRMHEVPIIPLASHVTVHRQLRVAALQSDATALAGHAAVIEHAMDAAARAAFRQQVEQSTGTAAHPQD